MIITRTPLRISLGGGGTDLPVYYREAGHGFLIAAAITKYVFIAVNRNFDDDILLKYSSIERVDNPKLVQHKLLRECLTMTDVVKGVEISSMADIPAGTGLGSSGSFTVGVLKALHAHKRDVVSNKDIAKEACEIEIDRLGTPSGKQDQYIAAIGGVTAFEFHADGKVKIVPLDLSSDTRHGLDDNLMLFYTGIRRSAGDVLDTDRQKKQAAKAGSLRENLDEVREIGYETMKALTAGDLLRFGELLTEQWDLKHLRAPTAVHDEIDGWIRTGIKAGATGGKLVGAGDGGFLLMYAENKAPVREAMENIGLEEVRFAVDYHGATTLVSE